MALKILFLFLVSNGMCFADLTQSQQSIYDACMQAQGANAGAGNGAEAYCYGNAVNNGKGNIDSANWNSSQQTAYQTCIQDPSRSPSSNEDQSYCAGVANAFEGNGGSPGVARSGKGLSAATAGTGGSQDITLSDSDPCMQAANSAKTYCNTAGYSQMASGIGNMMSQFSAASASGNIKGACETSKKINELLTAANGTVAALCFTKINDCDNSCDQSQVANAQLEGAAIGLNRSAIIKEYRTIKAQCDNYQGKGALATYSAVQNAGAYMQSQECIKQASGECIGVNALQDPNCQQYCTVPSHMQSAQCQQVVASCANPTYATQNAAMCTCVNNPTGPGCPGSLANANTNGAPNLNGINGDPTYNTDPCTGSNCPQSQQANGTPPSGQGNFAGGLGGGVAPIMGAGNSDGKVGNDAGKDILQGVGGGAAGGMFGYGGGGYSDGGGGGKSGSSSAGGSGLDLKAFLPGGKKDPRRGIASIGGIDPSITNANGLTNFQKITRKMNEKRSELIP